MFSPHYTQQARSRNSQVHSYPPLLAIDTGKLFVIGGVILCTDNVRGLRETAGVVWLSAGCYHTKQPARPHYSPLHRCSP